MDLSLFDGEVIQRFLSDELKYTFTRHVPDQLISIRFKLDVI